MIKSEDVEPAPNHLSDSGTTHKQGVYTVPYGDTRLQNEMVEAHDSFLSGDICLINSEDSASFLAMFFYSYMFLLWVLLLILVTYFYSRVAHSMFLLRNIHDKMFSLHERGEDGGGIKSPSPRSYTPRTASLAQENEHCEYNVQYHHQIGLKERGLLPAEGVKLLSHDVLVGDEKQGDGPCLQDDVSSNGDLQTNNEGESEVNPEENSFIMVNEADATENDSNKAGISSQNPSQNTLNTDDSLNEKTVNKVEVSITKNFQLSADSVYETQSLETYSCLNLSQSKKVCQDVRPNSMENPRSKSMDDFLKGNSEASDAVPKRKSLKLRKFSSKRKSGKVPKIKVSKTKEKSKSNDAVSEGEAEKNVLLHPVSSNSLLVRRIKSMENVNAVPKLDCLQVPCNRKHHGPIIPKDSPEHKEQKETNSRKIRREPAAVIGKLTNSSTSLKYTRSAVGSDKSSETTQNAEKTLTLTRSSAKGKRNVCVLPLTGLTTKAAIQNQESEEKKQLEIESTAAGLPSSIKSAEQKDSEAMGRRGNGMDTLENAPRDESVKLRLKSASSCSSVRKTVEIEETPGQPCHTLAEQNNGGLNGVAGTNTRRVRPSTADILSERHRRGTLHPVRTSRMLFVISMAFLVSFFPFFVIVIMRSFIGSSYFLSSLNLVELGAVSIFVRSTLLSNAVNPVIYGLLSTHFRRECTGTLSLFRTKIGNLRNVFK